MCGLFGSGADNSCCGFFLHFYHFDPALKHPYTHTYSSIYVNTHCSVTRCLCAHLSTAARIRDICFCALFVTRNCCCCRCMVAHCMRKRLAGVDFLLLQVFISCVCMCAPCCCCAFTFVFFCFCFCLVFVFVLTLYWSFVFTLITSTFAIFVFSLSLFIA